MRKPALESFGSATVVCSETGQTLREDRPFADPLVAEEPSDAQTNSNGNSLPGQVGQRPRLAGMDSSGSRGARWTTSCRRCGSRSKGEGVCVGLNTCEVQHFGSGQDSAGVRHEQPRGSTEPFWLPACRIFSPKARKNRANGSMPRSWASQSEQNCYVMSRLASALASIVRWRRLSLTILSRFTLQTRQKEPQADSNRFPAHYECAVQSPTMQGVSPFYPLYNLDNSVL